MKKFLLFYFIFFSSSYLQDREDDEKNTFISKDKNNIENEQEKLNKYDERSNNVFSELINLFQNIIMYIEKNITNEEVEKKVKQIFYTEFTNDIKFEKFKNILMDYYKNQQENKDFPVTESILKITFDAIAALIVLCEKIINNNDIVINSELVMNAVDINELCDNLESFLSKYSYFIDKSPILVKEDKIISLCKELNLIQNTLVSLIGNIGQNIEKKSYNKIGFFSEIVFGRGGAYNKTENPYKYYQNEIIWQQLIIMSNQLQKNIILIDEVLKNEIQEKTFYEIYNKIIEQVVQIVCFIELQIENKFIPICGKDISLKSNKNILQKEIAYISKNIFHKKKKLAKLRMNKGNKNKTSELVDTEIIFCKRLYEKITELNKAEKNLCLYSFQRIYRSAYFSCIGFREYNNLSKFSFNLLHNHTLNVMSFAVFVRAYLYIKDIVSGGIFQKTINVLAKVYTAMQNGFSTDRDKTIYSTSPSIAINDAMLTVYLGENPYCKEEIEAKLRQLGDSGLRQNEIQYKRLPIEIEKKIELALPKSALGNPIISELLVIHDSNKKFCEESEKRREELSRGKGDIIDKISSVAVTDVRRAFKYNFFGDKGYEKVIKLIGEGNRAELTPEYFNKIREYMLWQQEGEKKLADSINLWNNSYHNIGFNGLADTANSIFIGPLVASIAISIMFKTGASYAIRTGILNPIKSFFNLIHAHCMGDSSAAGIVNIENSPNSIANINEADELESEIRFDSQTFDHLRKQGVLEWPEQLLEVIRRLLNGEPVESLMRNLPKCILYTGESGSGKTLVAKTLAASIESLFKKSGNKKFPVNFVPIEPKNFNGIIENGQVKQYDILTELENYLDQVRIDGGVFILFLDEFHLFLAKDGLPNQERLADFLKFFNDLNNKQKNMKNPGGMFVIASTNRPDFIPNEFFANGGRIGAVYEINYPTATECVNIMKMQLKKNNMILDYIDFDYFEQLMQQANLNYSDILRIVSKALNHSIIQNKIVDNDILYNAFNDIVRKINLKETYQECTPQFVNSLSEYYAGQVATSINCNFDNSNIMFDCATIYPINRERIPQHLDKLYTIINKNSIKYGSIFYLKNMMKKTYSKKDIAIEIVNCIAGLVYLDLYDIPKINVIDNLSELYTKLYNYFALQVSNIHIAKKIDIGNNIEIYGKDKVIVRFNEVYDDATANKQIKKILIECEKLIREFYKNPDVYNFIKILAEDLNKNKILQKNDIIHNKKFAELLPKINALFNSMIEEIVKLIV